MPATRFWKIAAAASGLVLAGAATAAAVAAPDAADTGRTNASDHAGWTVPVGPGDHADDHESDAPDVKDEPITEDEAPDSDGGPQDNHGAAVSAVAHDDTLEGRDHGKAVSEVARSDAGKPAHDESSDEKDDEGGGETDD